MNLHQLRSGCATGVLAFAILAGASAPACAAAPSAESIDRLLEITQVRRTLDSLRGQFDGMIRNSMQTAVKDQPLNERQRAVLDRFVEKMTIIMNEELNTSTQLAMMRQVYGESFTQDEIDRLIALYSSENGQLLINKLPQVTQKALRLTQERLPLLVEKMRAGMKEVEAELKAGAKDKP